MANLTVSQLRARLDELEAEWKEKGFSESIGDFGDTSVLVPYYDDHGALGGAQIIYSFELGVCIFPADGIKTDG